VSHLKIVWAHLWLPILQLTCKETKHTFGIWAAYPLVKLC
jgi:hypothetical protein